MHSNVAKYKLFSRRMFMLAGINMSVFSIILARYYKLQILDQTKYKTLSDNNCIKISIVQPIRGIIYGRDRTKLVENERFYRIVYDMRKSKDYVQEFNKIKGILKDKCIDIKQLEKLRRKHGPRSIVSIADEIAWKDIVLVEIELQNLLNISVEPGYRRVYLSGSLFAHTIGYIGIDHSAKLTSFSEVKEGKAGLERYYNKKLSGIPGLKKVEVNAHGRMIRELEDVEPVHGEHLITSLNTGLQRAIVDAMMGRDGAATVMDIETGQITAMYSSPSFDPGIIVAGDDSRKISSVINSKRKPMTNKAISEIYPPGSTFKIVLSSMALLNGISNDYYVVCKGWKQVGRRKFKCWKHGGHGRINLHRAIAESCNVYFYEVGIKFGISQIDAVARMLGLGQKTGIQLYGESPGVISTKAWKLRTKGVPWYIGDTANASIGQGFIAATPLQLCLMMARVVSGRMVVPTLEYDESIPNFDPIPGFSKHIRRIITSSLSACVNSKTGVAKRSALEYRRFKFGGKTGTAQVASTETRRKRFKNHALFVGFAPVQKPKYAISVVVEHGEGGAAHAAPIARDIFNYIYLADFIHGI